ncbi:NfeD family protein [Candidatus Babeliales bacterium]|nr:NfeD family protein [Candidatus Babeliales bacterium]
MKTFFDSLPNFLEQHVYQPLSVLATPDALLSLAWFALGIVVLVIEINMPGLFYFISLAFGCFAASLLALLSYSLFTQCVVALSVAVLSFECMRRFLSAPARPALRTNIEALHNEQGIVIHTIEATKTGRVKVNGEEWAAVAHNHHTILQKGTPVRIIGTKGNKVIVKAD